MNSVWIIVCLWLIHIPAPVSSLCPHDFSDPVATRPYCYIVLAQAQIEIINLNFVNKPHPDLRLLYRADNKARALEMCKNAPKLASNRTWQEQADDRCKRANIFNTSWCPDYGTWALLLNSSRDIRLPTHTIYKDLSQFLIKLADSLKNQKRQSANFQFFLQHGKSGVIDLQSNQTRGANHKPGIKPYKEGYDCGYYVADDPNKYTGYYMVDCDEPFEDWDGWTTGWDQLVICEIDAPKDCIINPIKYCEPINKTSCKMKERHEIVQKPDPHGVQCPPDPTPVTNVDLLEDCKDPSGEERITRQCIRNCTWSKWTFPPCRPCEIVTATRYRIQEAWFGGSLCHGASSEAKRCPIRCGGNWLRDPTPSIFQAMIVFMASLVESWWFTA